MYVHLLYGNLTHLSNFPAYHNTFFHIIFFNNFNDLNDLYVGSTDRVLKIILASLLKKHIAQLNNDILLFSQKKCSTNTLGSDKFLINFCKKINLTCNFPQKLKVPQRICKKFLVFLAVYVYTRGNTVALRY